MKKLIYSFAAFIIGINIVSAKQVESGTAKQVAENFIGQHAKMKTLNIALSYTERSVAGQPDYYVFDINSNTGFIIVSAEDAGRPIIGYSTEHSYQAPSAASNPNFNFWMQKRKEEIEYMRDHHLQANAEIAAEWNNYSTSKVSNPPQTLTTPVAPLCQTTWNQNGGGSPAFNQLCPSGSVTGCVATAMAQIMRKWSYPPHGYGSSSYCDCTANGYTNQYGTLSVNYATETYNWASMPYYSSSTGAAQISYDAGVSVAMNYDPNGSGAQVCGGMPSAQYSYVNYFGYDPAIHCEAQTNYTTPVWNGMLEAEFTAGRPVQYQGFETAGGHTWVADGNDASDNIDMNWGWGGYDNGYFSVTNLSPSGMGTFNSQLGGLFGIQPLNSLDAGIASIGTPAGTICSLSFTPSVTLQNFGTTTLTSCTINYKVDNTTLLTKNWTGSLTTGQSTVVGLTTQTSTAGAHTFTAYTSSPNGGADGNTTNDQSVTNFSLNSGGSAQSVPVMEGFQSTFPPTGWSLYNTGGNPVGWAMIANGHNSTQSAYFNNCNPNDTTHGLLNQLRTTTYDFTNPPSAVMTFDVAYAQYDANHNDGLAVYYSTDCGTTWTSIYNKSGATLATVTCMMSQAACGTYSVGVAGAGCFNPNSAAWRNESINLSSLIGQAAVMFAFENIAAYGSGIYLDNINIGGLTGVASVNAQDAFNIYPNPASTDFTIEGTTTADKIHYTLYNIVGAEVKTGDIAPNNSRYTGKVQVSDISPGMYFIKVSDGKNSRTKKLNIQ